jgi:hypothetical protein
MTTDMIGVEEVLGDPYGVAERLLDAGIYGLTDIDVRLARQDCVVFWVTLEPWATLARHDYPTERVAVTMWATRRIAAVPINPNRPWLHRYPGDLQELCLWCPADPRGLTWDWSDGLVAYLAIVHRHLQAEECWRRHGVWPGEDAPHGEGSHPILSLDLLWAASQEAGR